VPGTSGCVFGWTGSKCTMCDPMALCSGISTYCLPASPKPDEHMFNMSNSSNQQVLCRCTANSGWFGNSCSSCNASGVTGVLLLVSHSVVGDCAAVVPPLPGDALWKSAIHFEMEFGDPVDVITRPSGFGGNMANVRCGLCDSRVCCTYSQAAAASTSGTQTAITSCTETLSIGGDPVYVGINQVGVVVQLHACRRGVVLVSQTSCIAVYPVSLSTQTLVMENGAATGEAQCTWLLVVPPTHIHDSSPPTSSPVLIAVVACGAVGLAVLAGCCGYLIMRPPRKDSELQLQDAVYLGEGYSELDAEAKLEARFERSPPSPKR